MRVAVSDHAEMLARVLAAVPVGAVRLLVYDARTGQPMAKEMKKKPNK